MGMPYPCKYLYASLLVMTFLTVVTTASAQRSTAGDTSQPAPGLAKKMTDSLRSVIDTSIKAVRTLTQIQKDQLQQSLKSKRDLLSGKHLLPGSDTVRPGKRLSGLLRRQLPRTDSLRFDMHNPFKQLLVGRPLVKVNGGYVSYQFNYRSAIDTPYAEKDIAQHNITGNLNLTVAGHIPLRLSFWSRQSNSAIFRDITDVQASFDAAAFQQHLQQSLRQRLLAMAPQLRDSLTEQLLALKNLDLDALSLKLKGFSPQDLVEAHETIKVPRITWLPQLPDSVNRSREDSLKKAATVFLDLYTQTKGEYEKLSRQVDSLKKVYEQSVARMQQFKQLVNGRWEDLIASRQWTSKLQAYGLNQVEIPAKYKWLLGLRQFSVGRSVTNYSELTVKNTSVNGINLEYNSWYYLALSAGLVDYRYRDFVINGSNKRPQYLFLARAGLGRLEKNYVILSVFRGEKQLFPSSGARLSSITVTGISAEAKMQLNRYAWISAEIAKSMAPDFRNNPVQGNTKFDLSDASNQAYAVKAFGYLPQTGTKLEGYYKRTGANYQSFSSFQTNAALESWNLKGEQAFFKRKLRVAASLRKNEFTNPFLPQDYNSNTVFKSLTASFRQRKWPVITIGYQPMSQLTALDSVVIENRFQVLNGSAYHTYKLGTLRTASTLVLNKYYNTSRDTAFLYYNATNVFAAQQFYFPAFTAQVAVSYTHNGSYRLVVMDEGIQLNLRTLGTVGFGVKINNLNKELIKAGAYVNANIRVFRQDFITLSYDRGYLPGFNKSLVRNEMATIQFVKSFGFR